MMCSIFLIITEVMKLEPQKLAVGPELGRGTEDTTELNAVSHESKG